MSEPTREVILPIVLRSHLIDVNLLLDYLIQASGECQAFDEQDIEGFQVVLNEIQSHVNALFPEVERVERRLQAACASLVFSN